MAVAAALLWYVYFRRLTLRRFGGVTGDLLGFLVQTEELFLLLGLALGSLFIPQ